MKLQKLSLFGAVAGALISTAAFVPQANATLITYFNFEDAVKNGAPDLVADTIAAGNPGGGLQAATAVLTYGAGDFKSDTGLLLNRSAGDIDTIANGSANQALRLDSTGTNQGSSLCFTANTSFLTNLALSFAVDNNGNGFDTVELTYQINGGTVVSVGTQPMPLGGGSHTTLTLVTFSSAQIDPTGTVFTGDGTPQNTEFCLVFTGSNGSSGKDRQTVIDNIQLNADVVPEPSTYIGGLLGIGVFCWSQRRRLIRSLRLRRA